MHTSLRVLCVALLAAAVAAVPALGARTEKVIYDDGRGNALIAHGGTKEGSVGLTRGPIHREPREPSPAGRASLTATPEEVLIRYHAWKNTPYGDAGVTAEFWTDLWTGVALEQWASAEGLTYTCWWGTVPQYNSDQIELGDTWRFSGCSVSVSVPGGAGFSVSGTTAKWTGGYSGGDAYDLWHMYAGVEAQSWFWISSMRQSCSGSHFFRKGLTGSPIWVTAIANQGKSTLI